MASTATLRANRLGVPVSHRDEDAKDASTAAHLFATHWSQYGPDRWRTGMAGSSGKAIPDGLKARLESPDGRVQRGARFDLTVYRMLGILSKDDAYTTISLRVLAKRLGYKGIPRNLRRSIARLEADGSICAYRWPWRSRKGTAYHLPEWEGTLRELGSLRPTRPEIADLLETIGHSHRKQVDTVTARTAKQVDTLSQSLKTQIKTQPVSSAESPDRTGARPRSAPSTARPAAAEESLYADRDRVQAAPRGLHAMPRQWTWAEWNRYLGRESDRRSDLAMAALEQMKALP